MESTNLSTYTPPIAPYTAINFEDIIEKIKTYITENNVVNHVFLVSAASLSNLIIHQLYFLLHQMVLLH